MANGNLIQGARRLGQSKRFVDYGKVLGEAMKPTQGMLLAKQQYFQAVKEKEAKTQNFIDNLSDLDITKIPTGLRDQVTDFLTTGRQKYYDASERAANARMGSEEYRDAVREMNTINNSFRNLSGRLENLQQARTEFIQNYDQGMVSKGNQNYDEALSILGADLNDPNALNLSISESGDIGFIIKGADGQDKIVNEIPNYFNKASNVSNSLAKMSETYNINGQRGIEVTDQILRDNVYRTIGDNRENIVSLATDSWLGAPALINQSNIDTELYQGLTGAELLDPANQAALKSYVNDRYYNGIKDAYSSGYGVYNRRKKQTEQDGESEEVLRNIMDIRENSFIQESILTPVKNEGKPSLTPSSTIPMPTVKEEVDYNFNDKVFADNIANEYGQSHYQGSKELFSSNQFFRKLIRENKLFLPGEVTDKAKEEAENLGSQDIKTIMSNPKGRELYKLFLEQFGQPTRQGKKLPPFFEVFKDGGFGGIGISLDLNDPKAVQDFLLEKKYLTKGIISSSSVVPNEYRGSLN